MGADIHNFVEYKTSIVYGEPEVWVNCDHFKLNPHYNEDEPEEMEEYGERKWERVQVNRRRDYNMFSVLADVRNNGWVEPISKPRGLPEDVSKIVKDENEIWDTDGHSHSWLTLKEIKDWAKNNKSKKVKGWLSQGMLDVLEKEGKTDYWYSEQVMPHLVEREFEVELTYLDKLIDDMEERKDEVFSLKRHRPEEEWDSYDDKIRLVFWFDN